MSNHADLLIFIVIIQQVMLGPSVLRLHGVFFRHLWFFKDNYFGYDDKCTPLAVHLHNRPLDKTKSARVKRPCAQVGLKNRIYQEDFRYSDEIFKPSF